MESWLGYSNKNTPLHHVLGQIQIWANVKTIGGGGGAGNPSNHYCHTCGFYAGHLSFSCPGPANSHIIS